MKFSGFPLTKVNSTTPDLFFKLLTGCVLGLSCLIVMSSPAMAQERFEVSPDKVKMAVNKLSACGNFIDFDDQYVYSGFGSYWTSPEWPRLPSPGTLKFLSLENMQESQIQTLDSVVAIAKGDQSHFILTYSAIEEWDLKLRKPLAVISTKVSADMDADEEHPKSWARYHNTLVIAHGRRGVSFFDMNTRQFTRTVSVAKNAPGFESVVNDISIFGHYAFAVLDSYTLVGSNEKPAFRGIVILDIENGKVVSSLDGLEPGADNIVSDGQHSVVSFFGIPLLKYSNSKLFNSLKMPSPLRRVWKFPLEGQPSGRAAMDSQNYYTCFSKVPGPGQGSHMIRIPVALERAQLGLE